MPSIILGFEYWLKSLEFVLCRKNDFVRSLVSMLICYCSYRPRMLQPVHQLYPHVIDFSPVHLPVQWWWRNVLQVL